MGKNFFHFLSILFFVFLVSCDRVVDDPNGDEMARLNAWLIVNNYSSVQPTPSGLYYISILEGTGNSLVDKNWFVSSLVKRDLDDNVYETTDSVVAELYGIFKATTHYVPNFNQYFSSVSQMKGLAEGLGMMKEGGKARLIIPSSIGVALSNTTFIYDIELKKVVEDPIVYENELIEEYRSHHSGFNSIANDSIYFKDSISETVALKVAHSEDNFSMANDSTAEVKYVGKYLDGFIFDTNIESIATANGITVSDSLLTFKIGSADVINGFNIAVKQMRKGGVAKVIIPSKSAYGAEGKSPIPPYTTLLFEITLVDIYPTPSKK